MERSLLRANEARLPDIDGQLQGQNVILFHKASGVHKAAVGFEAAHVGLYDSEEEQTWYSQRYGGAAWSDRRACEQTRVALAIGLYQRWSSTEIKFVSTTSKVSATGRGCCRVSDKAFRSEGEARHWLHPCSQ